MCINEVGTYRCDCFEGFKLKEDRATCESKCRSIPQGNMALYSLLSVLQIVYMFQYHTDINECTEGGHNCSRTQCCVDTIGGFECQCGEGFEPNNDGLDCVGMYVTVDFILCSTYKF